MHSWKLEHLNDLYNLKRYEAVQAVDEIRMSQDSFFENMSDNSKATAFNFFRGVGDLAPANYDVMRHKVTFQKQIKLVYPE